MNKQLTHHFNSNTIAMLRRLFFATTVLLLLSTQLVMAGKFSVVGGFNSSDLQDYSNGSASGAIQVPDIGTVNSWSSFYLFPFKDAKSQIRFYIDEKNDTLQEYYTAQVVFDLIYYTYDTSLSAFVADSLIGVSLAVENQVAVHKHDKVFELLKLQEKIYYAEIQLQSLTVQDTNGNTIAVPENLRLDLNFDYEAYSDFSTSANSSNTLDPQISLSAETKPPTGGSYSEHGNLEVTWMSDSTAEEYDIEWVYLHNYGAAGELSASGIPVDFSKGASRVTISGEPDNFKIPLVYRKGYVVVRVRPVGRYAPDFEKRWEGPWSSYSGGTSVQQYLTDGAAVKIGTGHETTMNYSASISFAEDAKLGVQAGYVDGSGMARQQVANLNTEKVTVVGESIHDFYGRPVMGFMPVPAIDFEDTTGEKSHEIKYYNRFNQASDGSTYNWETLEAAADTTSSSQSLCVKPGGNASDTSGAAHYYSDLNPLQDKQQAFLPDADGFAFVQSSYKRDNTGRVTAQGGVGQAHQLGSGHETKMLYGEPAQYELNRLFGLEAGFAEYYEKTVIQTPNGQLQVAISDPMGRTVATSLAGNAPENMQELQTIPDSAGVLEIDVISPDQDDNKLIHVDNFIVVSAGYHSFDYELSLEDLFVKNDSCNYCYNCVYDLHLSLKDECGTELFNNGLGLTKRIGNLDSLCQEGALLSYSTVLDSTLDTEAFTPYLGVGNYKLTKSLTVNNAALDYYADRYVETQTCGPTYQTFLDSAWLSIDSTACGEIPCDSCATQFGDSITFVAQTVENALADYLGDYPDASLTVLDSVESAVAVLAAAEYTALVEECEINCAGDFTSCEVRFEMLKQDVSPGGQFALYDSLNYSGSNYPLSVLNDSTTNALPLVNSANNYTDLVFGSQVYSQEQSGFVAPQDLSHEEFVKYFDSKWLDTLVTLHPEYDCYLGCLEIRDGHKYLEEMKGINTYAEADSLGYLDPLQYYNSDYDTGQSTRPSVIDTSLLDPYFSECPIGTTDDSTTYGRFAQFIDIDPSLANGKVIYTIWDVAAAAVNCGTTSWDTCLAVSSNQFGACTTDTTSLNTQWTVFKGFYMSLRNEWEQNCPGCDYNFTWNGADSSLYAGKIRRFGGAFDLFNDVSGNDLTEENADSLVDSLSQAQAQDDGCFSQCEMLAEQWLMDIDSCTASSAKLDSLKAGFIEVCQKGCELGAPIGASILPNTETTASGYNSFEDVMNDVLGTSYRNAYCDINLIGAPTTITHNIFAGGNYSWADSCTCSLISEADSSVNAGDTTYCTAAGWLNNSYGSALSSTELSIARLWCNESNDSIRYRMERPVVPAELTCEECIVCDQVQAAWEDFTEDSIYGSLADSTMGYVYNDLSSPDANQFQKLLQEFLKKRFGFNYTYWEWKEFLQECDAYNTEAEISSLLLDGVDDYVRFDTASHLAIENGDFSAEGWFKPEGKAEGTLIAKSSFENCGYWSIFLEQTSFDTLPLPSKSYLTFLLVDSSSGNPSTKAYYRFAKILGSLSDWHHYAFVKNGSNPNDWHLYIDGTERNDTSFAVNYSLTDSTFFNNNALTNAQLWLGGKKNCSYTGLEHFDGYLREVRAYSRAMNTSEIEANAASLCDAAPSSVANLILHAKLDTTAGDIAIDYSNYGHNGEILDTITPPMWLSLLRSFANCEAPPTACNHAIWDIPADTGGSEIRDCYVCADRLSLAIVALIDKRWLS